jgi:hypothetical protein
MNDYIQSEPSDQPFRLDYVESQLARLVSGHLYVFDFIIDYGNQRFLHLRKAILPGVATRVVTIEVPDGFQVATRRARPWAADRSLPENLLAYVIVMLFYLAGSEADA